MTPTELPAAPPTIDPEFKAVLAPLSDDERLALEQSIEEEGGARDPLVTWDGVLLDGHHRLGVCQDLALPYRTVALDFPDREAAKRWVLRNQLGRRNLAPTLFRALLGALFNSEKAAHGTNQHTSGRTAQSEQSSDGGDEDADKGAGDTAARLAKQYGVSRATVVRAGAYDVSLKALEELVPGMRDLILRGRVRLTQAQLDELVESKPCAPEQVQEFLAERRAKRQPSTPKGEERPFLQFEIKERETFVDPDTMQEVVVRSRLGCPGEHWITHPRRVLATTKSKTAPCYECGSGTRTPADRRRLDEAFESAYARVLGARELTPEQEALRAVVKDAIALTGMPAGDQGRVAALQDRIGKNLRLAGMFEREAA